MLDARSCGADIRGVLRAVPFQNIFVAECAAAITLTLALKRFEGRAVPVAGISWGGETSAS